LLPYNRHRTHLSALFGDPGAPITPQPVTELLQCGMILIGFDKLTPFDGRLEAAVWSWNTNEPNDWNNNEDGAEHYHSGRFNDVQCDAVRQFACKKRSEERRVGKACTSRGGTR